MMLRHGAPDVVAVVLVLLGSTMQVVASGRLTGVRRPPPTSATVVNVVAPAAVLFIAAAVAYVRIVGLPHGSSAQATTVVIALALFACAAYALVVGLIALAVAVANHGVRTAWSSLWVMAATSVTAAVLLPLGWTR